MEILIRVLSQAIPQLADYESKKTNKVKDEQRLSSELSLYIYGTYLEQELEYSASWEKSWSQDGGNWRQIATKVENSFYNI